MIYEKISILLNSISNYREYEFNQFNQLSIVWNISNYKISILDSYDSFRCIVTYDKEIIFTEKIDDNTIDIIISKLKKYLNSEIRSLKIKKLFE